LSVPGGTGPIVHPCMQYATVAVNETHTEAGSIAVHAAEPPAAQSATQSPLAGPSPEKSVLAAVRQTTPARPQSESL
jgi:hypothetical protein